MTNNNKNTTTTQQANMTTWLKNEEENLTSRNAESFERLPALKLKQNVVVEVTIDDSKPFEQWEGQDAKGKTILKKIIPVSVLGERMNWWLNRANPVYGEIIKALLTGQKTFKVLQTGTQADTKYVLVK